MLRSVDVVVEVADVRIPDEVVGPAPEPDTNCAEAGIAMPIVTTNADAASANLIFMGRLQFKS